MSSDKDTAVDFLLVPTMTPRQVVSLLLSRYPTMRDLVCPDEHCFEEPTRVYDSFARVVIERSYDLDLIQSVVRFIDELAESNDPLIKDVLISSLLEGIAENEQLARMISGSISPRSKKLLQEVESKIYGRAPSAEET
jgi:hypothetical protein